MSQEKILEKIKKLLAMTESSNPNEANVAMAKAQRLMTEHNIEMHDIERSDGKSKYDTTKRGYTFAMEERYIRGILHEFFVFIFDIPHEQRYQITGTPEAIAVANYMWEHIRHKFKGAWHVYKKKKELKGVRGKTDYYAGLHAGLHAKLTIERETQNREFESNNPNALIILDDEEKQLKEYTESENGLEDKAPISHRRGWDPHAEKAGYMAGRKMNLNPGLKDGRSAQMKIGG